ncbi:MAG: NADPH-dependent glutamate synthase [Candidatus Bathyarchaeota archaeon]|nr:NADPH-dependent glutamate synthase [Candidatus Bathyarchaeota archaeon]
MPETKSKKARRMKRQLMPRQPPDKRIHNFNEVTLGYSAEQATAEASRCLQCPDPSCVKGCPVGINMPAFIKCVKEGDFDKAIAIVKERNSLPAMTGRVCPWENQCEAACILDKIGEPVAIGRLERFVADHELKKGHKLPEIANPTGHKVAVVGSGPAGLTAAADLAKLGHSVVMLEALHKPGGVLSYGIPEFRLPKNIVKAEVSYVEKLGVSIETNIVIGKLITVDELLEQGFDAVFIASGAGAPNFLNLPGENLCGVYSANEFLTRSNLMKAYAFPEYDTPIKVGERVAVIGGGNVAVDAARTALRLGADEVYIVYRRSEKEMPARVEEIDNAKEEFVKFKFLTNPVRFQGNEREWVKQMKCIRMKLGELDKSGRRMPMPIEGSEFLMNVDTVVVAIGQKPNPLVPRTTKGLQITRLGTIVVDEKSGKTTKDRVWAGGDIVSGAATVIEAMGMGKRAAKSIHEYLTTH